MAIFTFKDIDVHDHIHRSSVRLGEHDLSTDTETKHVDLPVTSIIQHPNYDKKDGHSDLAILVLGGEVPFSRRFFLELLLTSWINLRYF